MPRPAPKFGLYTLGVQTAGAGANVSFDYFKVNGSTGCGAAAARQTPPVITSATATPTAGFAPLATAFTAAATDADSDALTYSWDFNGNGTADATGASVSNDVHHRRDATWCSRSSDGKGGTATKNIPVQVLAADDANAKLRALVFSKTAASATTRSRPANALIQALGTEKNFQVDRPRTPRCSRTRSSATTTS